MSMVQPILSLPKTKGVAVKKVSNDFYWINDDNYDLHLAQKHQHAWEVHCNLRTGFEGI